MEMNCSNCHSIEQHADTKRCTHIIVILLTQQCKKLQIIECLEQYKFCNLSWLHRKLLRNLLFYISIHTYQFSMSLLRQKTCCYKTH